MYTAKDIRTSEQACQDMFHGLQAATWGTDPISRTLQTKSHKSQILTTEHRHWAQDLLFDSAKKWRE